MNNNRHGSIAPGKRDLFLESRQGVLGMPHINLADLTAWMSAAGLLTPLAGVGRQLGAPGAISHAPRRRLDVRDRVSAANPALAPRTIRRGAAAGSSRPSEATATDAIADGRSSPIGALGENRLSMRWQQDQDGALVMSWIQGTL
jgi:hypothetical protein